MQYKHLCLIFGLTPFVCGRAINWMLRRTVRLLNGHPFVKVKFPDNLKMREYGDMIQAREPLADDVMGSWMVFPSRRNALANACSRTCSTVATTARPW